MTKAVIGVSDQFRHKTGYTATKSGNELEIANLGNELYYLCRKTKALISYMVTAQLIYALVFAYAKSRFSPDTAQFSVLKCCIQRPNVDILKKAANKRSTD